MAANGQPNNSHAVNSDYGADAADLARQLETVTQDLRQKSERLSELSESAHRFVEDVAHDFRTPLTVIQEFASIMADGIGGDVNEKHREFLDLISCATRDLAELVDNSLIAASCVPARCGSIEGPMVWTRSSILAGPG